MTGWHDSLRPASFRGVPFCVNGIELTGGRRGADHEYPGRDTPFAEDLGRKQRTFSVEAIVLEPDHIAKAQRLQAACEEPGAGTLVHPWLGEQQVACRSLRLRFATQPAAAATLSIDFVEAGAYRQATRAQADFGGATADAAAAATTAAKADYAGRFESFEWLDAVADDASELVAEWTGELQSTLAPYVEGGSDLAGWAKRCFDLGTTIGTMIRNPAALADEAAGLVGLSWTSAAGAFAALTQLAGWRTEQPDEPWLTAASAKAITANRVAVETLTGSLSIAAAADALADPAAADGFASANEVASGVAAWDAAAAALLPNVGDDGYRTLTLLRARVKRLGQAMAADLPHAVSIVNASTRPALAIAQAVYGDRPETVADGAARVVRANAVRHPLFVPVGAVEVLVGGR